MDRSRFEALAEAYGGDVTRWPEGEREAALALLAAELDAVQPLLNAAARLDAALDALPAPQVSHALRERVLAAAPKGRTPAPWRRWLTGAGVGLGLATACAAGLAVGVSAARPSPEDRRADAVLADSAPFDAAPDADGAAKGGEYKTGGDKTGEQKTGEERS